MPNEAFRMQLRITFYAKMYLIAMSCQDVSPAVMYMPTLLRLGKARMRSSASFVSNLPEHGTVT